MVWIVYGILLLVYWNCPKYLKVAAFAINFFVPDPIPYIDEVIMVESDTMPLHELLSSGILKNF